MIEAKPAAFKFEKFKIPNFSYTESLSGAGLKILFNPSGIYYQNNGNFDLILEFVGDEDVENGKNIITVKSISTFKFEDNTPFQDLPDYFYKNALAIVFPYMRSFVSALTLLSNSRQVILGLTNLSSLEKTFRDNTVLSN